MAGGAPLRIGLVAPPYARVPPVRYGGTERVVAALAERLVARGHDVTLFASGDSRSSARLVATVPHATWDTAHPIADDEAMDATIERVADDVGRLGITVLHAHVDVASIALAERVAPIPVVATFHLPVDEDPVRDAVAGATRTAGTPLIAAVAISRDQASRDPAAWWTAVVPNGLPLHRIPFGERRTDDLAFVGRIDPEKGLLDAIEVARIAGRRLRVAAKIGVDAGRRRYYAEVVRPALQRPWVDDLGELDEPARNELLASSAATLMPIDWPEPFGLVAIESLAAGTPVIARRRGALPEIVEDGIDGAYAERPEEMAAALDDVLRLDRRHLRERAIARFDADVMATRYEAVYRAIVSGAAAQPSRDGVTRPAGARRAARTPPAATARTR